MEKKIEAEKKNVSEEKQQKSGFLLSLKVFRFINFCTGAAYFTTGLFTDLYFQQTCPACAERMKYMRESSAGTLYTCFNCYKSWIKKRGEFNETKLQTK